MIPPLAGNDTAKRAVDSFITSGRIPHAILIEGDDGTGKHTLAAFIARAAVCDGDIHPCGQCKGCHLAEIGSHPDITYVLPEDGKKNITVDRVRTLRADAFVKPHMASHRVFIIDGADRMNTQAQNALLKVLEEPPSGVIFILITPSRTALLETVVSRCSPITLIVPEYGQAVEYMTANTDFDGDAIRDTLDEVGGNIGKAISILDGSRENPAQETAVRFIELLFDGSELDLLYLLQPFEKDRVLADEFFSQLKIAVAKQIRKTYNRKARSQTLTALYAEIGRYQELLKTNINLSLLFSAVVCISKRAVK